MKESVKPDFNKTANKVSAVSIIANTLLSLVKLLAGILAHSQAMISDAIHSASDVFSTIIVILGIRFSAKEADDDHPYGHERMECVAAIILSLVLFVTGLGIGSSAFHTIISEDYVNLHPPGSLALAAALISILVKEAMYWYTRHYALSIDSPALMADAWHHRSDALSSIGALVGIVGARYGYSIMDPLAGFVIFFFIIKAAFDIFRDAMDKMVDHSCDPETERAIYDHVLEHTEVLGIDLLHTRIFGNKIYVDVEISLDGSKPLSEAHEIAEQVHDHIEEGFPQVKHIMVHVNPASK